MRFLIQSAQMCNYKSNKFTNMCAVSSETDNAFFYVSMPLIFQVVKKHLSLPRKPAMVLIMAGKLKYFQNTTPIFYFHWGHFHTYCTR